MTKADWKKLWPGIKGQSVRIAHGYVKKHIHITEILDAKELGQDIYLKLTGDDCLTIRSIKSITLI